MNVHKNARLTPKGREILVRRIEEEGLRVAEAAQAAGVSERTAYKWLKRFREEGVAGLGDRSSRPHGCPHETDGGRRAEIESLRRRRLTYREIAERVGVGTGTVSRVLRRAGLNRLPLLDPPPPVQRYVWDRPGDMLHLDIKRLGRFRRPGHRVTGNRRVDSRKAGWEYVHVAIDDASRVAFATIADDQDANSACQALLAAVRRYRDLGVTFRRVMTDNGSCYVSRRFATLCRRLRLRHVRTRPYTPRTNGKAERFIQTALREWAYARAYDDSHVRARCLPEWLHRYNWHRPHASLGYRPPIETLNLNNLVAVHS